VCLVWCIHEYVVASHKDLSWLDEVLVIDFKCEIHTDFEAVLARTYLRQYHFDAGVHVTGQKSHIYQPTYFNPARCHLVQASLALETEVPLNRNLSPILYPKRIPLV